MDKEEVQKFTEWMAKMKNIHYSNDEEMASAYERIAPLKYREI